MTLDEAPNYSGVWRFNEFPRTTASTTADGKLRFYGDALEDGQTATVAKFHDFLDLSTVYSSSVYELGFTFTGFDIGGGESSGQSINLGLGSNNGSQPDDSVLLKVSVMEGPDDSVVLRAHSAQGDFQDIRLYENAQSSVAVGDFQPVNIAAIVNLDAGTFDLRASTDNGSVNEILTGLKLTNTGANITSISLASAMEQGVSTSSNYFEIDNLQLSWHNQSNNGENASNNGPSQSFEFNQADQNIEFVGNEGGSWAFNPMNNFLGRSVASTDQNGNLKFSLNGTGNTNGAGGAWLVARTSSSDTGSDPYSYDDGVYEFSYTISGFSFDSNTTSGNWLDIGLEGINKEGLLLVRLGKNSNRLQLTAFSDSARDSAFISTASSGEDDIDIRLIVDMNTDTYSLSVDAPGEMTDINWQNLDLLSANNSIAEISLASRAAKTNANDNFISLSELSLSQTSTDLSAAQATAPNFITERPDFAGVWVNNEGLDNDFDFASSLAALDPFTQFMAGETSRIKWKNQWTDDGWNFSQITKELERASFLQYYWSGPVWTGQNAPDYVIGEVGSVQTVGSGTIYPNYYNPKYRSYAIDFIDAYAAHIASLPLELRERVAFVQSGFGSTGDQQLFEGNQIAQGSRDWTTLHNSWTYFAYMKELSIAWIEAFQRHENTRDIHFIWKIDSYAGGDLDARFDSFGANRRGEIQTNVVETELAKDDENKNWVSRRIGGEKLYASWMRQDGINPQTRAQQFPIAVGPMVVREGEDFDNELRATIYGETDKWDFNPEYVRGEMNDNVWAEKPMARQALRAHYYWTAISGVYQGLDGWETKWRYLVDSELFNSENVNPIVYDSADPTKWEHFKFSHRYSFQKKPETSPVAFIALRDALDYEDVTRFRNEGFEVPGPRRKQNIEYIDTLLSEFNQYGAQNEDGIRPKPVEYDGDGNVKIPMDSNGQPKVQTRYENIANGGGSGYLGNSSGLNDVVWNVIRGTQDDGNYNRFIEQIYANDTSSGWWRVGWYALDANNKKIAESFPNGTINTMVEDPHPYGRFARAFDVEKLKNEMQFRFVEKFSADNNPRYRIDVTYYNEFDEISPSWTLLHYNGSGYTPNYPVAGVTVDKGDKWNTVSFFIEDAGFGLNAKDDADFKLQNGGSPLKDYKFHLIEVEKL